MADLSTELIIASTDRPEALSGQSWRELSRRSGLVLQVLPLGSIPLLLILVQGRYGLCHLIDLHSFLRNEANK